LSDEFTLQADGEPRLNGAPITLDASRAPAASAAAAAASPDPAALPAGDPDGPDAPARPTPAAPTPPIRRHPDGGSVVVSQPGPRGAEREPDGASGVLSDAVVLTFSEAMDTSPWS
jgi:hypothetical protein